VAQYEDTSTVVSILPVPLSEVKPGLIPATYQIGAVRDPSKEVQILVVARARFPVYIDETRPALIVPEPSDRVAESICRDFKVSMAHVEAGVSEPGLFWLKDRREADAILSGTDKEGREELVKYRVLQTEWFKRLVSEADDYWSHARSRRMISDLQRKACKILNLEREWNLDSEVERQLSACKFCFALVHPSAIVCPSCRGILNMERYKKEFSPAETVR
jgi:hypothetical protein